MTEKIKATATEVASGLAKSAPSLMIITFIMLSFLFYLDRIEDRKSQTAQFNHMMMQQQIEQLDSVAQDSNELLGRYIAAAETNAQIFKQVMADFVAMMERNQSKRND